MAVSEENLLSLGHHNVPNVNTFSIYRNLRGNIQKRSTQKPFALQYNFSPQRHQMLQTIRLQQRWQELKDRERAARHHNQELLQQFERAQDTLRKMMAATAAMKTIRMEYEPFLVESSPYSQKQLKEKTQPHHSKNFQLQHLIATPSHPQSWARQNPPGCAPNQADVVPSPEDAETSGSSRRKSFNLSQELDLKPVRLFSDHAENGDSSTSAESRQVKSEKKRKTNTTSERGGSSSQSSSMTSSAAVSQTSESEASSHEGKSSRMRRNIGALVGGLPMMTTTNATQNRENRKSRSISDSQSEHVVSQSPLNQSESSSRGNTPSRSEESSGGSDNNEGMEDEEADGKSDGKEESDEEDNEDDETSSDDEIENESGEDQACDDGISDKLNKKKEHEAENDSDDIIIPPQQNKPRVRFILQECSDDDDGKEGSRTGSSDEDSSEPGDDDIEALLAPQAQAVRKEDKGMKAVEEPKGTTTTKVICDLKIFRGETHTDQQSDSDEFDHFYD
ncbi:uncharacterized protein LOC144059230 isoform X2 [Vanacampus margaritifer]